MALLVFGLVWHAFALTSYLILAPYGKKWEGFYLTLIFGPIGIVISLFIRSWAREHPDPSDYPR